MKMKSLFDKRIMHFVMLPTVLVLTLALCFGIFGVAMVSEAAPTSETVDTLEQQIAKLEAELKNINNQLAETKRDLSSELENKAYIDNRINTVNQDISKTEELIEKYRVYIAEKEAAIADKNDEVELRFEEFCQWLNIMQKHESTNYVEMIFESSNFVDMLTSVERLSSMMEYQTEVAKSLDTDITKLEEEMAELEKTKAELEETEAGLVNKKKELSSLSNESARYISDLKNDQSSLESMYAQARAKEDELNLELEAELERLAKQNTMFIGGDFMWPLDASWNSISSYFGIRTLYGVTDSHNAIDIPAYYGSNIYASNGGTIVKAQWHSSYGNYVLIDHGGGLSTLYAHCSSLAVSAGDKVSQGDVIGYVGSTGYSFGNHLHFEYRIDGVRKNPLDYVAKP